MEGGGEKPWTGFCTVVAMDSSSTSYMEKTPHENNSNPGSSNSRRLYRLLLSVATVDKVMTVICFDRAARVLFGCSADEFFNFCNVNPFAEATAGEILEGEMFKVTLSRPKNGNAQHLRAVSMVPVRSEFRPVIETLRKKVYGVATPSKLDGVGTSSTSRSDRGSS